MITKILYKKVKKNSTRCPICNNENAFENTDKERVKKCMHCKSTHIINFKPLGYQTKIIHDNSRFLNLGAGVGTGKTTIMSFKFLYRALIIPNADSVMVSGTLDQLKATAMKDFMKIIPDNFVVGKLPTIKSVSPVITFINNHTVSFLPSDNEQKLRSLNLITASLEEANGVDESVYNQLVMRIRDASKPSGDLRDLEFEKLKKKMLQLSMNTNPDSGYVYDSAIALDPNIKNYAGVDLPKSPKPTDKHHSSYIIPTSMNPYLDEEYYETLRAQLSEREYKVMVEADFKHRLGRIIENVDEMIVENLEEKVDLNSMPMIFGLDFGMGGANADPQALIKAHLDLKTKTVYFTGEKVHDQRLTPKEKVDDYYKTILPRDYSRTLSIVYDSINGGKSSGFANFGETLADLYKHAGLKKIKKAKNGEKKYATLDRVEVIESYLDKNKILISKERCPNLISDLKGWTFDPKTGKPRDKNNHTIDAMTFILIELGYWVEFESFDINKYTSNFVHEGMKSGFSNKLNKLNAFRKDKNDRYI